MKSSTSKPVPATLKKLESGYCWCCSVGSCKGVVGRVRESRDHHYSGSVVELNLNFEKRNGVYSKTKRAASRIKELVGSKEEIRADAQAARDEESNGRKLPLRIESVAAEIEAPIYARDAEHGIELSPEKLPAIVRCPSCSREVIITTVR